ncbi:lysine-rich coiled-coil protein 1 [Phaethornis superciliosus]
MAADEAFGEVSPPLLLAGDLCEGDILDEATRKDLFTDTFCKVCKAVLQFESQRMSHYQGQKHARKVWHYIQTHGEKSERQEHGKQKEMDCISSQMDGSEIVDKNRYCNLCNKFFTSPIVALSHYLGKIHAKKLKQLSGEQANMLAQSQGMQPLPALQKPWTEKSLLPSKADESLSSSNTGLNFNDPGKFCGLCCAPFSNPFVAQEHYTGKKHRRNEARKKLLEELGDKAIPVESGTNAVGAGYYLCHVCNITLTSIETYQSHMQGYKHRNKEAVLASLRKESKKTNGSFQGEITDYFSVQEYRDLQPGGYLGKPEKKEFQDKNTEGGSNLSEVISSDFKCDQVQHYNLFSETQSPTNTGENKSPSWPSALENTPNCQYNKGCCKEEQASEVATIREKSFSLLVAQSECMLAETSTSFFRKEEKFQVNQSEDTKFTNKELKHGKETTKQKRKKNTEGADFGKENEKLKRLKVEIDLVNEKTSRPCRDRRLKESPAEEEMKQPKKGKKTQTNVKREEELLWDESVLGYC